MEDVKHWLTSKTAIAALLGMIITFAKLFGLDQLAGIDQDTVAQHVVDIVQGALYLGALVGRLVATKKLVA